jgi:oligogalacturonide lyase
LDPATEFPVVRLTDPAHSAFLPDYTCRAVSRRNGFLLYSSDRTGALQAFRMDLRTGESTQLTDAAALDPSSLTLVPGERRFCYFDGPSLRMAEFRGTMNKEVYRAAAGFERGPGLSVAQAGNFALVTQSREGTHQALMVPFSRGPVRALAASREALAGAMVSPRGDAALYRQGTNSLCVVRTDGRDARTLPTAPGGVGPAYWSADGESVIYLSFPAERGKLNSIREISLATRKDALVAVTSQYVHFAPNADGSVFVGASGSVASPYVLLLLRHGRREVTLCEHRSKRPERAAPFFSPESQRIYFESDREGRPALYTSSVERLVESTG